MNNFEKIRNMTIDEMANFLYLADDCENICNCRYSCLDKDRNCAKEIKKWLKSEVKE